MDKETTLKNQIKILDKAIEILSNNDPKTTELNLSYHILFTAHADENAEEREKKEHKELSELKEKHSHLWKTIIEKWIKLGEALKSNTTIKLLIIKNNHYIYADPKIFEAIWQGIASNTTIQELRYLNNCLGRQRFAYEPIPMNAFFSALTSNQTLTHLNLNCTRLVELSEPQWKEFSKAIESHPTLKTLNLAFNWLGSAEQRLPAFQSLTSIFQKNKTLTTLNLAHNTLFLFEVFQSEKNWQNFCEAITQNKSLTHLDLSGNRLNGTHSTSKVAKTGSSLGDLALALGSHPTLHTLSLQSNGFGELYKENWERLWNGLAKSHSLRKVKVHNNEHVKNAILNLESPLYGQMAKESIERLQSISKALQDHQALFEIECEEPLFNSESYPFKAIMQKNRKEKHGTALTIAHCLYNIQIKNNKMHQKGFPKGIISNILSFLTPQALNKQVITEIETHNQPAGKK